jgi:hypothetical protein
MFKNSSKGLRIVVSAATFISVFTAILLQVQSAHALTVTRAMAGNDGIWEAQRDYTETIWITQEGVTVDLQGHSVIVENDWGIVIWYEDEEDITAPTGVISTGPIAEVASYKYAGIRALDSKNQNS